MGMFFFADFQCCRKAEPWHHDVSNIRLYSFGSASPGPPCIMDTNCLYPHFQDLAIALAISDHHLQQGCTVYPRTYPRTCPLLSIPCCFAFPSFFFLSFFPLSSLLLFLPFSLSSFLSSLFFLTFLLISSPVSLFPFTCFSCSLPLLSSLTLFSCPLPVLFLLFCHSLSYYCV